ncbi:alanine:cation symporter family protein [Rhodococcus sp. BP-149]|uniref:alanine/glycine:cation symporter family protein n=1 Tax=unclassified Rhodococcus (in: high G+C Gram-positive bacteria) TaxID=192944 RepID=UPI001C9AB91B|nr:MULTISPECIES: alanine/glycine:cation symporter family protein [unclassified Rhodococcus (in: high G+C Gram-positive bacteria)]MBY6685128.1 alanine:cation symporter family protein [Rhodococcus sp. BP-288]MBY6692388.1 alanine:cation symporter family protein [Rhodococcus sp. BP-188]MBY6698286.1 alanine:cation symporter family protein [Rhodococcus sp. BP-285]MBY6700965.1 alanine:cation symporter family protein [Rhodococcus sp. BP-283]MBY6711966.1 alanine:cation symporter family protein [Rhodoco
MTSVPRILAADGGTLTTIENAINSTFEPVTEAVTTVVFFSVDIGGASVPLVVLWLLAAAIIFTITFKFLQVRGAKHAVELVRGQHDDPTAPGEVSHFRALTAAVSGTVGLGNIAGVAVAVTLGGPGATLWMILAGFLGMATKFVECTLGVKYRDVHEDGTVSGGPMKYLTKGLAERGMSRVGKIMATVYAVIIIFFGISGGNMFQANQTYAQVRSVTGGDDGFLGSDGAKFGFGLVVAVVIGLVIIGGMKSISAVTAKLVPAMAIVYVLGCAVVIAVNIEQVPGAMSAIVTGAFSPTGVAGGVLGVMIIGIQRAAFSNEAGLGSASIAHSAVKTRHPVTEGFVAMLEPFIDTVVICTATALTIVIANTQSWQDQRAIVAETGALPAGGVTLTSDAFETVLPWFPYILTVAVALFALSTAITWAYYGSQAWTSLFGRSALAKHSFNVIFCLFTVVGTVLSLGSVLDFADAALFALAFVNIIGLYLLLPVVKRELRDYMAHRRGETVAVDDVDVTG